MLNQKKLNTKILSLLSTLLGNTTSVVKKEWGSTTSTSLAAYAGAWKYFTKTIPTGYTPFCVVQGGANHGFCNITGQSLSVSGSTATIGLFCQNITNAAITVQADAYVVFVKSSLL